MRNAPTRVSNRSGGGAFNGVVTDLYCRNLIACAFSSSSLILAASDFGFGFKTGFSSSGGNIHSGCGLSGAFFFFFFRGGSELGGGSSNSGLSETGAFGFFVLEGMLEDRFGREL